MTRFGRFLLWILLGFGLLWLGWAELDRAPQEPPGTSAPHPSLATRPIPRAENPRPENLHGIDRILIEKSARRLTAFRDGAPVRRYPVALGFAPVGDKQRQGDGKTPEGVFHVDRLNGQSKYHLSIGLDYPRPQDLARARADGFEPGGDIFIHGQPNQRRAAAPLPGDWTAGCIALNNDQIRALFAATRIGTPVEIRP